MEEDQAAQSLARLADIEQKVKQVQDKLETRLPSQRMHMAALLGGIKWRLQCQRKSKSCDEEAVQAAAKRVRMELGAFDYQTKEQAELLTRYLCELDDILSYGNAQVKDARKALVVHIQDLFSPADAMKAKSAKLKELGERVLETFLPPLSPPSTPAETASVDANEDVGDDVDAEEEENGEDEDAEEKEERSATSPAPEAATQSDNADDKDQDMDNEEGSEDEDEDDDSDDDDDAMSDEEEKMPIPQARAPRSMPVSVTRNPAVEIDVNSLPVWRPYYQLQRRPDGVYLMAKLHDTDHRNVRVQWSEPSGVLRVSGFKLPTQKDLMVSRFSGTPTFGRFEIMERFPRNVLDMDQATQQLREDGTLEIRMPYYYVQTPVRMQRAWYQPRDCFVW
jgi:hypothetical protein